jgi:hypothetical protein
MSSRVSSSASASPLRRHRYVKALPSAYSTQIAAEDDREIRSVVADLDTAVSGRCFDVGVGSRALLRLVRWWVSLETVPLPSKFVLRSLIFQAQLLKLKLRLSDSVWASIVLNGLKLCLAPVVEFRKQSRLFACLTAILKSRKALPDERVCVSPCVFT